MATVTKDRMTKSTKMKDWEFQTHSGNQCFSSGHWDKACVFYESAIMIACDVFDFWPRTEQTVASVVISFQNLAELHIRQNQISTAEEILQQCHTLFLTAINQSATLDNVLLRGLRHSHLALMQHIKSYGSFNSPSSEPDSQRQLH